MPQVKMFKSIESELWSLEKEVNEWIKANDAKIISITGNIAPQSSSGQSMSGTFSASDVLVIILYES